MLSRTPSAARLKRARALYDAGEAPLKTIAAELRIGEDSFRRLRKRQAWPPRPRTARPPDTCDASASPPAAPEAEAGDERIDRASTRRRLVRAIRREIVRVESQLDAVASPGAERRSRILASLAKTLAELRRLDEPKTHTRGEAGDDRQGDASRTEDAPGEQPPPRDLAALRQALVDRLEELRGRRNAG